MPLPSQTFSTIQALINYINTYFVTNGNNDITGEEGNNILNGLTSFIQSYTMNNSLAAISSSTGPVTAAKPITIFTSVPTAFGWPDNVQHEYYFVNATGFDIPLADGYSYIDPYQTTQIVLPLRTAIHIAKATNGNWIQINNLPFTGGTTNLPPQTGHEGQVLTTNGTSPNWADNTIFVEDADFEPDGVTYINTILVNNKFYIYFDTLAGFIYDQDGQWEYHTGGGFKILIPGINANTQPLRLHLFLIGLNS